MINIRIHFFASLADHFGPAPMSMSLEDSIDAATLRARLIEMRPEALSGLNGSRIAINRAFADESSNLQDGDEVAFIPPVSGG